MRPAFGTKTVVGLIPTIAYADSGFWIEPPISSIRPSVTMLAVTAQAVPALLPPEKNSRGEHSDLQLCENLLR